MKIEEKPKLITPAKLDHIMEICRETLEHAIAVAHDAGALNVYDDCVEKAKEVESVLKADALGDCGPPSWADMDDPSDVLSLTRLQGSPLEVAARHALFQVSEWRACVEGCGEDADSLWATFKTFEHAWTRLVMLRLHGMVRQ